MKRIAMAAANPGTALIEAAGLISVILHGRVIS